jgi:hypothetical protein
MIKVSVPTSLSDRRAQATELLHPAEKSPAMTNETEFPGSESLIGLSQVTEASSSGSNRLSQPIVSSAVPSEQATRNQISDTEPDIRLYGFTDICLSTGRVL